MVTAEVDQYEKIVNTLCKLKSLVYLNITASVEQKCKLPMMILGKQSLIPRLELLSLNILKGSG